MTKYDTEGEENCLKNQLGWHSKNKLPDFQTHKSSFVCRRSSATVLKMTMVNGNQGSTVYKNFM